MKLSILFRKGFIKTYHRALDYHDLTFLETHYMLDDNERALVFEGKVQIIARLLEWGVNTERLGLPADTWRPEQRESFIILLKNDQPLRRR